jgi:hypothetical protein
MDDIRDRREAVLRKLIKTPTEENAAMVRVLDKVLLLFNENRNVNS